MTRANILTCGEAIVDDGRRYNEHKITYFLTPHLMLSIQFLTAER